MTDLFQGYPEDLLVAIALGTDMFDCVWPTRTAVGPTPGHRWIILQAYHCCSGSGMRSPRKESLISSTLRSPKTSTLLSRVAHAAAADLEKRAVWVSQRHSFITLRPRRQWVHTCMSMDSLGRLLAFHGAVLLTTTLGSRCTMSIIYSRSCVRQGMLYWKIDTQHLFKELFQDTLGTKVRLHGQSMR
jgi:hypothetical protein